MGADPRADQSSPKRADPRVVGETSDVRRHTLSQFLHELDLLVVVE